MPTGPQARVTDMTIPKRIKPGDKVFVRGWPPVSLEVVDASDRSILVLRSEHGSTLKVGRLAVIRIETPGRLPG